MSMNEELYHGIRGYREETGLKRWYPAVGACLDILHPAPMDWISQEDLDEGAACHKSMELCLGEIVKQWTPVAQSPRVQAFIEWFQQQQFAIVAIETPALCKPHGFAGRPDLVVHDRLKGGYIIEVKYAESVATRRYAAQVESYTHLDPYRACKALLVQVDRAGRVTPHLKKPNPREWAGFVSALGVLKCRMS